MIRVEVGLSFCKSMECASISLSVVLCEIEVLR